MTGHPPCAGDYRTGRWDASITYSKHQTGDNGSSRPSAAFSLSFRKWGNRGSERRHDLAKVTRSVGAAHLFHSARRWGRATTNANASCTRRASSPPRCGGGREAGLSGSRDSDRASVSFRSVLTRRACRHRPPACSEADRRGRSGRGPFVTQLFINVFAFLAGAVYAHAFNVSSCWSLFLRDVYCFARAFLNMNRNGTVLSPLSCFFHPALYF